MSILLRNMLRIPMAPAEEDKTTGGAAGAGNGDSDGDAPTYSRPADMSEEEWNLLDEAEREAIGAPDDDETALRAIAGDEEEEEEEGAEAAAQAAAEAEAAAGAKPSAESKGDADAPVTEDEEGEAPFLPTYNASLPENFDQQMQDLTSQRKTLLEQFRAGEIEVDDYQNQRDQLDDKLRDMDRQKLRAEMAADMNAQNAEAQEQYRVEQFFRSVKTSDGIDYRKSTSLFAAINAEVKALGTEAMRDDSPNKDKPLEWFLREAHKRVKTSFGLVTVGGKAPAADAGKGGKQPADKPPRAAAPKVDDKTIPPSLGKLPAAQNSDPAANEFAYMDRLEGADYERALQAMAPADRERFISA